MLLERGDVNPDRPDTKFGLTPLSYAAVRGHSEVVKMFLERGDVNPNYTDTQCGLTPLEWTAERRHS